MDGHLEDRCSLSSFFQNNNSALSTVLSGRHNIYARTLWFDSWTLFANIISHSTLYRAYSQYTSPLHNGSHPLLFPLILSRQPWCPRGLHLVGRMHYLIGHQKIREEQLGTSRAGRGEENLLCNYFISFLWQLPLILRHRFKVTPSLIPCQDKPCKLGLQKLFSPPVTEK